MCTCAKIGRIFFPLQKIIGILYKINLIYLQKGKVDPISNQINFYIVIRSHHRLSTLKIFDQSVVTYVNKEQNGGKCLHRKQLKVLDEHNPVSAVKTFVVICCNQCFLYWMCYFSSENVAQMFFLKTWKQQNVNNEITN